MDFMAISIYTAKLLKTIIRMALRSFEYTINISKGIYSISMPTSFLIGESYLSTVTLIHSLIISRNT